MKTSNKQFDQLFKQKMQELHFEASDMHISELLKQTKQQNKLLRNKTWGKLSIILIIVNAAVFFQLHIRYNAKPPRYQAQNNFENLTSFTLTHQAPFTNQIANLNTQLVKNNKEESIGISFLDDQNSSYTEENWQKLAKKSLHEKTKLNAYHSKHAPAISGLFLFEGEKLKEGQTLTIVVSEGPTFATLPDISGADSQTALDQLTALGLAVTARDTNSEEVPAGIAIGWNVPEQPGLNPGDQLLKGTAIDLLVSVGPELREVPTIVGLKLEDAQKLVADLGLTLVETPAAKSNGADKGLIGAQSPVPGEKVARETGIAYSISLGPDLVKLPYLVGNRIDTVQSRLQEAGFVVGSVTGNQQGKLKQALIAGKSVKNNAMVPRGATVDLVFP